LSAETLACACAAIDVLREAGLDELYERSSALAFTLARMLSDAGRQVADRDHTTLVSFRSPKPAQELAHLTEHGVILREIPRTGHLRASVGAWNDQSDLDRLMTALLT
jgi:selenocysteine lyase/cysteine desulfurase